MRRISVRVVEISADQKVSQGDVIAVDLRGMGGSAKPGSGYDKKNMAKDIHELTRALGYKQVNLPDTISEQWSPTASLLTIQMRRSKSA